MKWVIVAAFAGLLLAACGSGGSAHPSFSIAENKSYEASLFRQNCAICHGPEAEGKTLPEGTQIPNLRHGPYKYPTDADIYRHISDGGNGMVPFRDQLTETEIRRMVDFVKTNLRDHEVR